MKITANEIQRNLLNLVKGSYDVVLPNFYFGWNECDVFRITQADFVFEYEIKISRADFFNDFKKDAGKKHDNLKAGTGLYCPNRFFFVVPQGLVSIDEVPSYSGLIYYENKSLSIAKGGKLIHKNKFTNYRSICHTLSERDAGHRAKIKQLRNIDFDKEMAAMKRECESLKKQNRELNFQLMLSKRHSPTL